jgi:hydroxysqualene synthase
MDYLRDPLIQQNFEFCKQIAVGHYENFPVGSILMPAHMRPHVFALYAFMRTADDYADLPHRSSEERLKELAGWRKQLDDCIAGKPGYHPVFVALQHTFGEFNIDPQLLYRLLEAFEFDARGEVRFRTFDDLRWYTERSAEPVGQLILALFGYKEETRLRLSNDICTGLQLLNFIQDAEADLANDRVYFPQQDIASLKIDLRNSGGLSKLLLFEADRTERSIDSGSNLPELVSGRLKYELRAIIHGARGMLRKIRAQKGEVLGNRPKLNRFEHLFILIRALAGK